MRSVRVSAAVIRDGDKILAAERGYGEYRGFWEFPGGKREEGESGEDAIIREIKEELGVTIETDGFIATIEHDYPDFHLIMDCYYAHVVEGVIKANEHMALRWISVDEIEGLEWLPADWKVLPFVREKAMHLEDSELNSEHIQKR
ncbi:MAG: (deoxy)nucleoside triphosphate pyrophosphohydrolase [Spirochaetes bacterium]|uniref:8-oxo-dGTP diphosphatase n=1 Tax=Candidatus Ornithospirochaeta stercoravium TaxID=2840897 RepID=A0A9D9IBZ4_9SPIO|nr:(deoxy)nucleoside triphosphate pyrophosphohydrolase [Candidatus Ornithospirochaeta stercoravium]